MILERGDMWSVFGKTAYFFVTTNPIRRKDGAVVMGRGIAKEMKDRFPEFPYDFGFKLDAITELHPKYVPHVLTIGTYDGQDCGAFMVKKHWREPADLGIIQESSRRLRSMAEAFPYLRFDLNFPGIGNGKLSREAVLPLLNSLPDNVHVWEYDGQ